jgi:hypothetical protein
VTGIKNNERFARAGTVNVTGNGLYARNGGCSGTTRLKCKLLKIFSLFLGNYYK